MTAIIYCKKCDERFSLGIEYASDLFDVKCPKCKSKENTWIIDTGMTSDCSDIKLGVHPGCTMKR